MAQTTFTTLSGAMAEPVIGRAIDSDGDSAEQRFGPAMGILVWLVGCAALWGLVIGIAALV
ncbi:MAG: hypothetical protein WD673_00710 [Alphaproteobacteria bacterium]